MQVYLENQTLLILKKKQKFVSKFSLNFFEKNLAKFLTKSRETIPFWRTIVPFLIYSTSTIIWLE